MAIDKADNGQTKEMFDKNEQTMLGDAITTHLATLNRKASAKAPKHIQEMWHQEVQKYEQLQRKVTQ